jgi:2-C-methyl-D-erythritol 2,4-cyclodiphosphate synthase
VNGPALRIGQGYDLHRLREGRRLVLAGVEIPFTRGLTGHSDADVVAHAVIDALLGAAALGDIGAHFPNTDPAYRDADSMDLLRRSVRMVKEAGWKPVNIDCTVIAEMPKLAPHIAGMRQNLADALGVTVDDVSVKAKTNEGVDATGRGEAIAAHAIVLISRL